VRATSEQSPSPSLKEIHDAISRYEFAAYLVIPRLPLPRIRIDVFLQEPLDVLPVLLPCSHDGATDLIRLCADKNSPKEVMLVLQEAIECLQTCLNHDEDDEEENDPDLAQRTIGVVLLCSPGSFTFISRRGLSD
jgi:hypothetical protein